MKLPSTLSASSLSNLEDCPAKFKAVNIDFIPEVGDKAAAKNGSAVHYALQWFVHAVYIAKTHTWAGIDDAGGAAPGGLAYLLELYDIGYEREFDTADTRTHWHRDGVKMLKDWHKRTDLSDRTIDNVESKKRIPLADTGVLLTYIFDRVERWVDPHGRKVLKVTDYKGLDRDTEIPTPTGWTTMAKIEEGDEVIGGDGHPCRVVHKSEIHYRSCYRISFDDGTSIICDDEHRWEVRLGTGPYRTAVMTPLDLLDRGIKRGCGGRQNDVAITVEPVQLPEANLPIDPYVFGAWIGDGRSDDAGICKPDVRLFNEIARRGYAVGAEMPSTPGTRTVHGIYQGLRELGVLGNKHLPALYLRASYGQRLDLLRGIMDTDGHWNTARRRAVLNTTNRGYAEQVFELVVSLGWTAHIFETKAQGFGREWDAYQLWFTPTGEEIFLARPPKDYAPTSVRTFRRMITSIEKVDTVATQCIEVDSPAHTFLAGRQMVKTHNTENRTYSFEELEAKLQARIYALCAAIEYSWWGPDVIQVELDMLRYSPTGVTFTAEDNLETWKYLLKSVHRIEQMDENKLRRTLGSGCTYCPIAATCEPLRANIDGGGEMSLTDIGEIVPLRFQMKGVADAAKKLVEALDQRIRQYAEQAGQTKFEVAGHPVKFQSRSTRDLADPSLVAQIIGPELMAMFGQLKISDVDKILDTGGLSDEQRAAITAQIVKKFSSGGLTVKVEPVPALQKEAS